MSVSDAIGHGTVADPALFSSSVKLTESNTSPASSVNVGGPAAAGVRATSDTE